MNAITTANSATPSTRAAENQSAGLHLPCHLRLASHCLGRRGHRSTRSRCPIQWRPVRRQFPRPQATRARGYVRCGLHEFNDHHSHSPVHVRRAAYTARLSTRSAAAPWRPACSSPRPGPQRVSPAARPVTDARGGARSARLSSCRYFCPCSAFRCDRPSSDRRRSHHVGLNGAPDGSGQ